MMKGNTLPTKVRAANLIIEVTRRCNMECPHCLRGDAENKDISKETVDTLLDQITEITSLTFTGGEPMLNMNGMRYIMSELVRREIPVYHVWFATNGTIYDDSFMRDYRNFIHYCGEWVDEICGSQRGGEYGGPGWLSVSTDQYHDDIDAENLHLYRDFTFYSDEKEKEIKIGGLLDEGRAYENGMGDLPLSADTLLCVDVEADYLSVDDILYINARGDVMAECNASYETQDDIAFGNLSEKSLLDMFVDYGLIRKPNAA